MSLARKSEGGCHSWINTMQEFNLINNWPITDQVLQSCPNATCHWSSDPARRASPGVSQSYWRARRPKVTVPVPWAFRGSQLPLEHYLSSLKGGPLHMDGVPFIVFQHTLFILLQKLLQFCCTGSVANKSQDYGSCTIAISILMWEPSIFSASGNSRTMSAPYTRNEKMESSMY